MQIPGSQFGNDIAAVPQAVNVPRLDAGQGLQSLGQAVQSIGGQELNDQRQRLEQAAQARASLALAKTTNDLHNAHDDVARGVLDGSIPTDKAQADLQARAAKIRQDNLDGMPAEQMQHIEPALVGLTGSLDRSLTGVVVKRQQNETAGTIDQFGEQVQREAMRQGPEWASQKFDAMVDFTGGAAGWTPEQKAAKKQAFKETTSYNFFQAAGTDALTKSDIAGLTGVMQKVQGPEGDVLDPAKRTQLTHQLFGWQQHLLAKQLRDANAADDAQRIRDNEAGAAWNEGQKLFQEGKTFDPDFIHELTVKGSGTIHEQDILGLLAAQAMGTGFATKPAAERDALLARMQSAETDPNIGTNPGQSKAIETLVTMNAKLKKEADDNPWQAAANAGRIPGTPQLNPSSPSDSMAIMQQRMKTIGTVEQWVGHKVSPLQPQEVEQIGKLVRTLPPDQAATMLAGFGSTIGDPERIGAVAKQIKDKDGTVALSMLYASAQTTQGRQVAELVLRGDQAIKDKAVTVDGAKETGWVADIAKQVNGAYPNTEVQEHVKKAAFLIMAARSADPTQGGVSLENAVILATGGIVERNGSKIPLPYGMKEDDFDKRIEGLKQSDFIDQVPDGHVIVGRTTMPLAEFVATIPKATLVHAGQGMYNVRAGSSFVLNSAGKRIAVKVSP